MIELPFNGVCIASVCVFTICCRWGKSDAYGLKCPYFGIFPRLAAHVAKDEYFIIVILIALLRKTYAWNESFCLLQWPFPERLTLDMPPISTSRPHTFIRNGESIYTHSTHTHTMCVWLSKSLPSFFVYYSGIFVSQLAQSDTQLVCSSSDADAHSVMVLWWS